MEFTTAKALLFKERKILIVMQEDAELTGAAQRGLLHIDYLDDYWCRDSLWQSWSDFGRHVASQRLNANLYNDGGMEVLPSIFEQHCLEAAEEERWGARIRAVPGGQDILKTNAPANAKLPAVVYLITDPQRDQAAATLLKQNCLSILAYYSDGLYLNCYSSLRSRHDANATIYQVRLFYRGTASCSCPDFVSRGGACKHIRAALHQTSFLRHSGQSIPIISLPSSEAEARVQQLGSMDMTGSFLPEDAPIAKAVAMVADILSIVPDAYVEGRLDESAAESRDIADDGITDDIESVATDAEGELDFTLLRSSRQAIDAQSMTRFAYEARVAAPKLSDLAAILPDHKINIPMEQVNDLIAFRDNIALLLHKIDRILPSGSTSKKAHLDSALTNKESTSFMPPTQRSSTVPPSGKIGPLPPSPEKSQKHKQSYSCH
ncbi:hypothetical protein M422DRAFT_274849 [Sphaerobolus stellatus SS14]|uniref:SWIM-type domain-containing protein n=1 Tax=Sphaerobolus stellatus (strain SS14) TaxID=990650 RepID=A0A0C9T644_SPHS4|nr:hypothetical protein M422DRAFT_274849 [Sphaerobolus stellatus SS14]